MTAPTTTDLLAQIDKVVEEKTFSLDAVSIINKLRELSRKQEYELEIERKDNLRLQTQLNKEHEKTEQLQKEIEAHVKWRNEAEKKVADGQAAINRAEVHAAQAAAYLHAMKIVFAPNTVRESIHKDLPAYIPPTAGGSGGYVSSYPHTEEVTRTEGKDE